MRQRNETKPREKERDRDQENVPSHTHEHERSRAYLRISGFGREIERLIGHRGAVLVGLHPNEGRLPRR